MIARVYMLATCIVAPRDGNGKSIGPQAIVGLYHTEVKRKLGSLVLVHPLLKHSGKLVDAIAAVA